MTVMNGHSGQHTPSEPVAIVGMGKLSFEDNVSV